jgi:hypothetical protein
MPFSSKQVVTMVCAVSAAAVLAPVGVLAATGQLVTITDSVSSTRKARVTTSGALQVETRPGMTTNAKNVSHVDVQSLTPREIHRVTGPYRMGVSEVTVGVHNIGNPVAEPTVVEINYYVRTSGTSACGLSGWTGKVLRRLTVKTDETLQVKFDGPPLVVPTPADGQTACLALKLYQWVGETKVDFGATVWTYAT